jgi:hypothetical protein
VARPITVEIDSRPSFEPPLPVFEPLYDLIASERLKDNEEIDTAEPVSVMRGKPSQIDDDSAPNLSNWPDPITLRGRLAELFEYAETAEWAASVDCILADLQATAIADAGSRQLLAELRVLEDLSPHLNTPLDPIVQTASLHARLELVRRIDVWSEVYPGKDLFVSFKSATVDRRMQQLIRRVVDLTETDPAGQTWRDYLQLNKLSDLAGRRGEAVAEERATAARRVIARMKSPRLTAAQRDFVSHDSIAVFQAHLRRWLVLDIPPGEILYAVETYEASRLASDGRVLAEHIDRLRWSPREADRRLGEQLERQYRNANLRLVVTANLLNRLLPSQTPQTERVNDMVVGVPTRGYSTTATQLAVRLLPDPNRLHLTLEASGVVDSQTSSSSGPVTFTNNGQSTYRVSKDIAIDRDGFHAGPVQAHAESATRLGSLQTNFDGVPIVRSLVRNYALSQRDARIGEAEQEIEAKVARRAKERFDAELTARLTSAEAQLGHRVIAPLAKLAVDPSVISLSTSAERMTMRFRVAGHDQLGAHTPRPLAMSDSLASLQIHESLLNNLLAQLQLAGRTFTLPELHAWINERASRGAQPIPNDLPEHVIVTFAEFDPVRVACDEGRLKLTLALAEIDQGEHAWYDMEATAYYRPVVNGQHLEFSRVGSIELGGEGHVGRVDFALRGIFAKILSQKRKLSLKLPADAARPKLLDLQFYDATIENGWISMALAPRPAKENTSASTIAPASPRPNEALSRD